jgi:hypothetical protein
MKRRFTRHSFLAHCNGNPTKKIQETIATLKIVAIHLSLDLETKYNFVAIVPDISSSILSSRNGTAGNLLPSMPSLMTICHAEVTPIA